MNNDGDPYFSETMMFSLVFILLASSSCPVEALSLTKTNATSLNSSSTVNVNSTAVSPTLDAKALEARLRLIRIIKQQVTVEYYTRAVSYMFVWFSVIILFGLRLPTSSKFFVHKQLLVSYLIADTFLLFYHDDNQWRVLQVKPLCIASVVLVYYFSTSIYTCMLVEGLHICIKLKTVFATAFGTKKHAISLFVAWGIPLITTGVVVGLYFDDFQSTTSCYSIPSVSAEWKWKGPIAFILGLNVLCFLYIQCIIIKTVYFSKSIRTTRNYMKLRATLRSVTASMPLLGITFILGFFVQYSMEILGYIFVISNGALGFLFFLFHVVLDKQVRVQFMKQVFGKKNVKNTNDQLPKKTRKARLSRLSSDSYSMKVISLSVKKQTTITGYTNNECSIIEESQTREEQKTYGATTTAM